MQSAIRRANTVRAKAGLQPIQDGVTNHTLRRTFCALLYEAGATPPYVILADGARVEELALEVYAKVMERKRDTGVRIDALIRSADWAQMGTSDTQTAASVPVVATGEPA